MREIKFRGKAYRRWIYGGLVYSDDIEPAIYFEVGNKVYKRIEWAYVHSETVGQFTGLTDINGKEIYEGDIVEHPYIDPIFGDLVEMKDGKGVKSVVVFHEGAFCVRYGEDVFYYLDQFTRHKHIEVVGNIHDNPELLEKGGDQ